MTVRDEGSVSGGGHGGRYNLLVDGHRRVVSLSEILA